MSADSGRVVIVTGGGAGIGLAASRRFAEKGAKVLITGRRGAQLEAAATTHPNIQGFVADAGDPADAPRTVTGRWRCGAVSSDRQQRRCRNSDGASRDLSRESQGYSRGERAWATLLAAAAVSHLEITKGSIINISSTFSQKAIAGFSHYVASKAALEHLTRCLALELGPKGIRVNAIASGPIERPFSRNEWNFRRRRRKPSSSKNGVLSPRSPRNSGGRTPSGSAVSFLRPGTRTVPAS
jgi:NAD(P)-dependent dehydrogenase (short-subunit alcohol dehydrogenase family)